MKLALKVAQIIGLLVMFVYPSIYVISAVLIALIIEILITELK